MSLDPQDGSERAVKSDEAELMLRGVLPYSIERVFLINRETGLLISHIADQDSIQG